MKKHDVLAYFKNRKIDVAKAVGISCASVSGWGEVIPERCAFLLERYTNGALKYNENLYRK